MTDQQAQELKIHYIGFKRTMTMNLPKDLYHAANEAHREQFGRPFRKCSKCIPNDIMSLLIALGVGID